jgi:hypothetical protein
LGEAGLIYKKLGAGSACKPLIEYNRNKGIKI